MLPTLPRAVPRRPLLRVLVPGHVVATLLYIIMHTFFLVDAYACLSHVLLLLLCAGMCF